jgi:putative ABC transport system permease protein
MAGLWRDLRYALRILAKNPGYTAVALLALTLGIGANAVVFTITNGVLLKGFPFDKSDRIVYMGTRNLAQTNRYSSRFGPVSYADFRDWRAQAKSLTGIAAARGEQYSLNDDKDAPETIRGAEISSNLFQLVGLRPYAGRDFTTADEAPGAAPVVMITYGLWQRRYGMDRSVVGKIVRLNGMPSTVIGVMPPEITFPFDNDLWIPLVPTADSEKRDNRDMIGFGRLPGGAPIGPARAEMVAISQNLAKSYPLTNRNFESVVQSYHEFYGGPEITVVLIAMLAAVAFVLLIACADIATLQLGRAVSRSREISIRIAVGASRRHLLRQLLIESLVLAAVGGILGWLLGLIGTRLFRLAWIAIGMPRWLDLSMDYRVLAYLLAISIGTGILFGVAPALRLSRLDVNSVLKDGGHGSSTGARGKNLANLLVVSEMALAIVLLAGAGLMIRSFLSVYQANLGVSKQKVLTMRLVLPHAKYPQPSDQIAFHDRLHTRLETLPGVESLAISSYLPTGGSDSFPYEVEGRPATAVQPHPLLSAVVISPNYFRVMSVGVLAGRAFAPTDAASAPPVAIVNRTFATKIWPGENPIGKRLRLFEGGGPSSWLTVVGLVPDILQNDISPREIDPLIYLPYPQKPLPDMAIVALANVPPGTLGVSFRRAIGEVDADLPVYNLWTLPERLERNYWFTQAMGLLFAIFAGIALFLASIGLYAVMAHSVSQRTQEIGVRMAMGASASDVLRLVFINGMKQVALGLVIGVVAAFGAMRLLKAVLVQVSPADPTTFALASMVLIAAGVLGCLIPALRAVRVDPVFALRHE